MTQQHPITPPPELVKQWREAPEFSALSPCVMVTVTTTKLQDIATQAARWGSDQELEACCEWIGAIDGKYRPRLRLARRPKPPSLKEQALAELAEWENVAPNDADVIAAAALRAAADQVVPEHREHYPNTLDERYRKVSVFDVRNQLLAIAASLENSI